MADESKSGLEELVKDDVQDGAGADGKMAQGQPGSGEAQRSKGTWITALPAELREGIEAEKYASLGEYVKDLQTRAAGKTVRDEKAFTESWDEYVKEMEASGSMIPEGIRKAMQESHVDAEAARRISQAVSEYGKATMEEASRQRIAEMGSYIKQNWKDFNENNELVKRGMRAFGKAHPDLAAKAVERKSIQIPEYAQLLVDYARLLERTGAEKTTPEGTPAPKEDRDNPFGLKNI